MSEIESNEDQQNDEVIASAMKKSLVGICAVVVVVLAVVFVPGLFDKPDVEEKETEITLPEQRRVTLEIPSIPLKDITGSCGIDWKHESGMEGEKLLPETMGGGVAVFDFDQDGDQDLLFVGGNSWPWSKNPNASPRSLCLYANDGQANFQDVTSEVGLNADFYAMGPAVADYNNDGWPDLFVTAVGENRLYQNKEGKFERVESAAGLAGSSDAWSTGSTWFDFDRDGLLDLFVCDYVVWNRDLDLSLGFNLTGVGRAYGQPTAFNGTQCHLYKNEGESGFREVTQEMGIEVVNPNTNVPVGKGLGCAAIDVDNDGWQDIVVANDTVQNFLFSNVEGKEFVESALISGLAFDRSGNATGAMGIDCGYFRNNDSLAIAIGNFANEQSSLYMTRGPEPPFTDQAMVTGLGPLSRLNLTFGICFVDLDLDSRQDLVGANGHLEEEIAKVQTSQSYEQPPQFLWNAGKAGSSELVALTQEHVGEGAMAPMVGRGLAYGDLDGDGDLDLVLVGNSGSPRILRNEQLLKNNWLRLTLQGSKSNRDALGAVVVIKCDGAAQRRVVTSTRSYLSQCESTLCFGLGEAKSIKSIVVSWPSGLRESFQAEVNQETQIIEGKGSAL
ncbi:MAG: CRTAC1 family protein [Planctomycetota bacterium]